jgi:replicative superfamily II helicase
MATVKWVSPKAGETKEVWENTLAPESRIVTSYSVAEYKNMVGRAGRLGYTERGESYLVPEGGLDAGRALGLYVNQAIRRAS